MITTMYNYTSGTSFLYDSTKIGFDSNGAHLLLGANPGQTFVPDISAATYDNTLLEYVGGVLRQKDQRPANATYYAAWTSALNANWSGVGNGSLTVTPFNGAAISSGVLNLTGSTNKYILFDPINNADALEQGSFEFKVTPNYTGSPSAIQTLFYISQSQVSLVNLISVFHFTDGNLYLQICDHTGSTALTIDAAWSPTSGTSYTILVQYNSSGASTIFINGSQLVTASIAFGRSGPVAYGAIGTSAGLGNSNFSISNLSVYSTVVTPTTPILAQTVYSYAVAVLPLFTYSGLGSVQSYTAFSGTDSGSPHYTLSGNYWDGMTWVISDESFTQSNDKATINANIAVFPNSNTLRVRGIYQAQNSPQQNIGAMTVTYSGQIYVMSDPTIAPNIPLTMDSLNTFVDSVIHPGSTSITYFILIGSVKYWWNGSAWAVSDGSVSQSNGSSVIQANSSTLPISLGAFVTPYAILHTPDGMTTPELTSLTLTYEYFGPNPGGPNLCTVYGYIIDENGISVSGATITVTNPLSFINQGVVVAQGLRTTKTNSVGYFTIDLVETASLSIQQLLTFQVAYTQQQVGTGFSPVNFTFGAAAIPNVPEANITSLAFQ